MFPRKRPCLIGAIALVLTLPNAWALRQYRCAGWVQYRPCTEMTKPPLVVPVSPPSKAAATAAVAKRRSGDARIVSQTFVRTASRQGIWKGVVEGDGDIHLHLHILRGGKTETVWYMGHVKLARKSSSFKFVTVAPKGNDWSWVIVPSVSRPG